MVASLAAAAQTIDGAEVARRMLQAAEAAAQAAASTASPFEPKDYGQQVSMWREWWWTVNQHLCTPDNNGYEAGRQLVMQCQPTSRNRSLGILNALMSWMVFDMKGALLSQIVRLEVAFREYDKISLQPLAAEMKFAILLRCISGQLRMHINVSLKEDATYDALREMVLQYDRASIKWTKAMSLGTSRASRDDGGAAPIWT
eukprot:s4938_g8.t1